MAVADQGVSGSIWDVHVVPSIHQDISYMKSAEEDLQLYVTEYKEFLDAMDRDPTYCYSSEFAYTVRHYLESRPQDADRLTAAIRGGRFGVGAQCAGFDPSFYSGEFVIREIADAKVWLRRTFGYEPRFLHLADVPDFAPQLPQVLAGCQVDAFIYDRIGSPLPSPHFGLPEYPGFWEKQNEELVQLYARFWGYDRRTRQFSAIHPDWWEWKHHNRLPEATYRLWRCVGLDGTATLAYASGQRYQAFRSFSVRPADGTPPGNVQHEVFIHGLSDEVDPGRTALGIAGFDEEEIDVQGLIDGVARWNAEEGERFGVRLHISTMDAFVAKIKALVDEGQVLPGHYSGIAPGWHTFGFDPEDWCAVQNGLPTAEKLASLCTLLGLAPYPKRAFERAWDILWLLSHNQRGDPSYFRAVSQTARMANGLIARSLGHIAQAVKPDRTGQPVVVFNPLNWRRDDLVSVAVTVPSGGPGTLGVASAAGEPIPCQVVSSEGHPDGTRTVRLEFLARDVPSVGYRAYYVEPAPREASDVEVGERWAGNRFYRVESEQDPAGRAITRVIDRQTGASLLRTDGQFALELVAGSRPPDLVRSVYDAPTRSASMTFERVETGGGSARAWLSVHGKLLGCPAELRLTVTAGLPRVDLDIWVDWKGARGWRVYLTLPFEIDPEQLRLGVACGHVPYLRPTVHAFLRERPLSRRSARYSFSSFWWLPTYHDPIPGDGFDWAYMQKWAYLGPKSGGVVLASAGRNGLIVRDNLLAVPLFQTPKKPPRWSRRKNPYQVGRHHWHLAIGTVASVEEAPRLGWETATPLLAAASSGTGERLPGVRSFVELEPVSAVLMALKPGYEPGRWALRFYENADRDTDVRLRFDPSLKIDLGGVERTNMLERPTGKPERAEGGLALPLRGFGIETLTFGPEGESG